MSKRFWNPSIQDEKWGKVFIEVYIDNRSVFIIVYKQQLIKYTKGNANWICLGLVDDFVDLQLMEQHALKNVNKCLNTNIYSYLETSGGQSSNVYLNVNHFFNTSVN